MDTLLTYTALGLFISFNIVLIYFSFLDKIDSIPSKYKTFLLGLLITSGSIILTTILHKFNMFDSLEYQLYDYRMKTRGYLSGDLSLQAIPKEAEKFTDLNANNSYDKGEPFIDKGNEVWDNIEAFQDLNVNNSYDEGEPFTDIGNGRYDKGLNVVLVEIDDESYRLINESYPFPRGRVYARAIRNLSKAGAKVIFFDLLFDKPDHQSETIVKEAVNGRVLTTEDFIHGDIEMQEAIKFALENGTDIILGSKIAYEPSRMPPYYLLTANKKLMDANSKASLVNSQTDIDGVNRRYQIGLKIPDDQTLYLTAAIKSVLSYLNIEYDHTSIDYSKEGKFEIKDLNSSKILKIDTYGDEKNAFLLNYYGPASGQKTGYKNQTFKTFNRYPLSNIIDNADYNLEPMMEDTDWMDQFLPGVIPDYILAIEDINQRKMMMDMLGIGTADLSKSPFNNKIIVIGTSLPEDQDLKITPYYNIGNKKIKMPGMEVHATAMQQLLDNNFISVYNDNIYYNKKNLLFNLIDVVDFGIITLISIITFLIFTFTSPLISGILVILTILSWIFFSFGLFVNDYSWILKFFSSNYLLMPPGFNKSLVIPIIFPIVSVILTYAVNLAYKLITEGQDKAFLKASFGNYISPELIDAMYESKEAPALGGTEGHTTPFFSDIASFSTFSEKLTPEDLVILLNDYLNQMTNILLDNNGTLDKYIGDAIIAFFGAPVKLENQEYLACLTCCQMNEKLEELRRKWKSEGDRWPEVVHNMRHRIGVNCGQVVTGNMGSDIRMNYTMMGDTVNVTARLESGAKQYGIETQVGEKVYLSTKDQFIFRAIDYAIVKGRTQPSRTYELISEKGKEPANYKKLLPLWKEALNKYNNQKWNAAIELFNKCNDLEEEYIGRPTNPSLLYIKRCEEFKINPPNQNWDGSYKLTSK